LHRMSASSSAPLILVVEDFDDAREMYRDYLELSGFRVATARDGREALEKTRVMGPDRSAGCDGFIAKPCLPPDLVAEIGKYLQGQSTVSERDRARRR
jgi:CheY-like chemotaxis protein